jgi:hypothetical protein
MDHASVRHLISPGPDGEEIFSKRIIILRGYSLVALLAFILLGLPNHAWSQPEDLSGSWRGSGWVSFSIGSRERARCRAHYVPHSGSGYAVSAICATDSGSVSQTATLRRVGSNTYTGGFYNNEYGVTGTIQVVVRGNSQSVTLTSDSGSASLILTR